MDDTIRFDIAARKGQGWHRAQGLSATDVAKQIDELQHQGWTIENIERDYSATLAKAVA